MRRKRNRSSNFPPLIPVLLIISVCLNIYFLVSPALLAGSGKKMSLQELQEIKEPGVYGPDDTEIVDGSFFISAAGVKLQNARINGDLFLTAGIGDGGVELFRVAVKDTALVEGGGEDTVIFEDAEINHLVINREAGKVRVVLRGDTIVEKVTIKGAASLSTADLSEKGRVGELAIETAADTELEGSFELVNVEIKEARVTLAAGAQVDKLSTGPEAEEALIQLNENAIIELLEAGADLDLAGAGLVKEVAVKAPGLFKFALNVEKVTAGGRGIFLQFDAGNTGTLVVQASEGTVMVHLAGDAVIENVQLDGAAGITGSGTIKRVKINSSGTTIEQKPGTVELAAGIRAEVGGETVVEEKPEPVPNKPSVSIGGISNRVIGPGQSTTISLSVSPGDASISVTSSNTAVVSTTLSGRRLTIKGGNTTRAVTATVTVRASKADHNSSTRTFRVTVDPISQFEVGTKLIPPVVSVKLRCSDPQNYRVWVGDRELEYDPVDKLFFGQVDGAKKSMAIVRRR